ncbi:MAG TPA: hypothetical protein VFV02_02375 [Acidimicrobiales bacterium]|nr:hypothetical protein [Acidimicrobiales bacterium]
MKTPSDQETAADDPASDVLAPTRHLLLAEVSDLTDNGPADEPAPIPQGLTRDEDDELRRLHWLSRMGTLAVQRVERLLELRLRDRRTEIREPREFATEVASTTVATAISEPMDDLAGVRRQLESMADSRLTLPFDDLQRERYRELLAAEHLLIERSKGNRDAVEEQT